MKKIQFFLVICFILIVMHGVFAWQNTQADMVLKNGKIWTAVEDNEWVSCVAIRDNKILITGDSEEIQAVIGNGTKVIDLQGAFAMPGFIDAHVHFMNGGYYLLGVKLKDTKNEQEFAERIRDKARSLPKGSWILEGNWDHDNWPGGNLPTKESVDKYTPENPVFVSRYDGHMALANSLALKLAGITKNTREPQGGVIVRDEKTGEPTGVLKDAAMGLVSRVIPEPDKEMKLLAARTAIKQANRCGVTTVQDMGSLDDMELYRELKKNGELKVRINERPPISSLKNPSRLKSMESQNDEFLTISGLKVFVDGSIGSSTAWFFEHYLNQPDNYGVIMYPEKELENLVIKADKAGYSVSVHAIGDRANSFILDVFEKAVRENGRWDRRFKIEHAQHLRSQDFKRYADFQVIASVQPYHAIDDGRWIEQRINREVCKGTYAFKSFLDNGVLVACGSDWTVAPLNPLLGVYAAVTRRTLDGKNPGGWFPEQKISLKDVLLGYTVNAAYSMFEEDTRGSIERGKLADIVILSDNLFEIDPVEIKDVRVEKTILGGEIVYNPQ